MTACIVLALVPLPQLVSAAAAEPQPQPPAWQASTSRTEPAARLACFDA